MAGVAGAGVAVTEREDEGAVAEAAGRLLGVDGTGRPERTGRSIEKRLLR